MVFAETDGSSGLAQLQQLARHQLRDQPSDLRHHPVPEFRRTLEQQIVKLQGMDATKYLYRLYAERVVSMRALPSDPTWDDATNFETK